ncbi:sulfotransferase, partial [Myxococcota bacterium]|nr:sulfotransferase [Myxococcota bacterium]
MFIGPLFIVGAPRSGTKLFRDLLRQHPRVAIPLYETELLPRLIQIAPRFGDLADPARFQA